MKRRSIKPPAIRKSSASEDGESLHEFLVRELPPDNTKQATYLTDALLKAGARYDRYKARKKEWLNYNDRRKQLNRITKSAQDLASALYELDILSRDDLASRIDPKNIEALIGALLLLGKETTDLAKEVQENGRPRDLAEERWILELADIYENYFRHPAGVWGSGAEPMKRRGKFYRLLELNRPRSFPRYGKLNLRQIGRMLKLRKKAHAPLIATLLP